MSNLKIGILRKSMIVNWFSFIFILSASSSKIAKTANFRLDVLFFVNFDVFLDFNSVNIKIKKNEDNFTFILFCKESGSAIRIYLRSSSIFYFF